MVCLLKLIKFLRTGRPPLPQTMLPACPAVNMGGRRLANSTSNSGLPWMVACHAGQDSSLACKGTIPTAFVVMTTKTAIISREQDVARCLLMFGCGSLDEVGSPMTSFTLKQL